MKKKIIKEYFLINGNGDDKIVSLSPHSNQDFPGGNDVFLGLLTNSSNLNFNSQTISNYGANDLIYLGIETYDSIYFNTRFQIASSKDDIFGPAGSYLFSTDSINSLFINSPNSADTSSITQFKRTRRNSLLVSQHLGNRILHNMIYNKSDIINLIDPTSKKLEIL